MNNVATENYFDKTFLKMEPRFWSNSDTLTDHG